uniref:Uncharacterized protein n=1 Tax=Melanopsichium pennsylvanicum 4 TaxID=1398559 RepID=A0A077R0F0_9BASI|nr:uncharacterized protein BN887_06056 [Melanopsichium pennsylvanicum 4]
MNRDHPGGRPTITRLQSGISTGSNLVMDRLDFQINLKQTIATDPVASMICPFFEAWDRQPRRHKDRFRHDRYGKFPIEAIQTIHDMMLSNLLFSQNVADK